MKYQVLYRLKHAQYLPTTSTVVVEAHTHADLHTQLVRLLTKWQALGYTVHIVKVTPTKEAHTKPRSIKKNM